MEILYNNEVPYNVLILVTILYTNDCDLFLAVFILESVITGSAYNDTDLIVSITFKSFSTLLAYFVKRNSAFNSLSLILNFIKVIFNCIARFNNFNLHFRYLY